VDDDFEYYLDSETHRFIRMKATQLAGRYGFRRDEREDVQQSLILACVARFRGFDPTKGSWEGFMRAVVNHAIATLIEARRAARRGHSWYHVSAEASSSDDWRNASPLSDSISEDFYRDRMGGGSQPFERILHLRLDVESAVEALPAELKCICRLLMALNHVAQVAVVIGVSRATLHRRVCTIRDAFVTAQLSNYAQRQKP
jgi:RNA polymerase sigma-70 factor, ECF subfamily